MGAQWSSEWLGPAMQLCFAWLGTDHAADISTHYAPVGLTGRKGD